MKAARCAARQGSRPKGAGAGEGVEHRARGERQPRRGEIAVRRMLNGPREPGRWSAAQSARGATSRRARWLPPTTRMVLALPSPCRAVRRAPSSAPPPIAPFARMTEAGTAHRRGGSAALPDSRRCSRTRRTSRFLPPCNDKVPGVRPCWRSRRARTSRRAMRSTVVPRAERASRAGSTNPCNRTRSAAPSRSPAIRGAGAGARRHWSRAGGPRN